MRYRPITQYVHNFSNGRYTPILRSKYASVVPFVEVHFKDRAVPIPQVNAQRSIMAKKSGSAIKLSTTSDTEFEVLFDFLMTGRYGAVLTVTGLGPPIILAQAGSLIVEPAPLVADVQAYRVATEAEVPEMQEFALRRMYSYDTIREDVVAVLDYIYHGAPPSKDDDKKKKKVEPKEPDSRLRQFVRMWLVRDHDAYKTNLGALRRNPVLMEKFSVLRAKGGLLITDVDYVDRQIDSAIEQATRVAMPPYVVAQQGGPLALQQAHVQAPVQARLEGAVVPHHGADWRQGSEAVFRIDGRASWPW